MKYNKDTVGEMLDADAYIATPQPVFVNGYIYIVLDTKFTEALKIGRTSDMGKRLNAFNANRPYDTAYIHCISKEFKNVHVVEKAILAHMRKLARPYNLKKEWFAVEHLALAEQAIKDCEAFYPLYI